MKTLLLLVWCQFDACVLLQPSVSTVYCIYTYGMEWINLVLSHEAKRADPSVRVLYPLGYITLRRVQ